MPVCTWMCWLPCQVLSALLDVVGRLAMVEEEDAAYRTLVALGTLVAGHKGSAGLAMELGLSVSALRMHACMMHGGRHRPWRHACMHARVLSACAPQSHVLHVLPEDDAAG